MATRTLFGFAGLAAGVVIGMSLAWVIPRDAPAPSPSTARDTDAPVPDSVPPPASLDDTLRLPGNFRQTAALYEMLTSADIPTLERLLAEAGTLASGQDATAARTIIYSRFVELDPERALADVLARGGPEQERYIHAVFENWAEIDPDAALDRAETLPERQRRDAAIAVLIARDDLPETEQRALATRFSIEPVLDRLRAERTMRSDPAAAWRDALASVPAGQEQNAVLWRIVHEWIDSDPRAAMAAIGAMPDQSIGRQWRRALVHHWMEAERDAAIAWVQAEASPDRDVLLAEAAAFLAQTSPHQALQLATGLDGPGRERVITATLKTWAQGDPRAAIEAVGEVGDAEVAEGLYLELALMWAGRDPGAAATWLASSNLAGEPLRRALRGVLVQWAGDDAPAAATWLETAPESLRERHVANVLHTFARQDARGAFAWLWSQPVETRRRSVDELMASIANGSPTVALDLLADIRDGQARNQAMAGILQGWSLSDPEGAARYLLGAAAGEFLSLLHVPVAAWVAIDPTAAAAFIGQAQPGRERDQAVWVAILELVRHDASLAGAALAEDLYAGIEDEESRQNAARALARHFEDYDEERAERYRAAAGTEP